MAIHNIEESVVWNRCGRHQELLIRPMTLRHTTIDLQPLKACIKFERNNREKRCNLRFSECLTPQEWNACLYLCGRAFTSDFPAAMQQTIAALLEAGYEFEGLDEKGRPVKAVDGGANKKKRGLWVGNPNNVDTKAMYEEGRRFVEKHLPHVL